MRNVITLLAAVGLVAAFVPGAIASGVDVHDVVAAEIAGEKGPQGLDAVDVDAALARTGQQALAGSDNVEHIAHFPYDIPPNASNHLFEAGTDIDFEGDYVYATQQGAFGGIHIIDVSDPDNPERVGFVHCPGSQNDVAVVAPGIVALGYHSTSPGADCPNGFPGIRLFDVSDPEEPVHLTSVRTHNSGTHTLTKYPGEPYIYASPGGIANGAGDQYIIDVSDPANAKVAAVFRPSPIGCHDFSFFDYGDRVLGFCPGLTETQVWDVTDPVAPEIIAHIVNPLIFFHHSAITTPDGRYLVIGDEAFGAHECAGGPTGAMFVYDLTVPEAPVPVGYYSVPRHDAGATGPVSTDRTSWCTAHLYNFIGDTYYMVASWYTGGMNVIDFSNPSLPQEVAYYQVSGDEPTNYWSAYWYDGRIYANDRGRGLDVFKVDLELDGS